MLMVVARDDADRQGISSGITTAIREAISGGSLSKWAMPDDIRFVDEITKTSVGKIDKKALRAGLAGPGLMWAGWLAFGLSVNLVDSDMRVIVVMEAYRRVVDLAKIEKLVETALEQLPVHQEHIDPVFCLDDLHGKVSHGHGRARAAPTPPPLRCYPPTTYHALAVTVVSQFELAHPAAATRP